MSVSRRIPFLIVVSLFVVSLLALSGLTDSAHAQALQNDPSVTPSAPDTQPRQTPTILKGGIKTLDAAIEEESGIVDWYGWYMACREYLMMTGGFKCPVGTKIQFYKDGRIRADSRNTMCKMSAQMKHFPLPVGTQLDILELPVRGDAYKVPPASEAELLKRIKSQSKS